MPEEEVLAKIDYYAPPIVICMNSKYHDQDLTIDGLTYKRKYSRAKDVDYELCLKMLLKYKANPNIELRSKKRPRPIFYAIKDAKLLKAYLDMIDD